MATVDLRDGRSQQVLTITEGSESAGVQVVPEPVTVPATSRSARATWIRISGDDEDPIHRVTLSFKDRRLESRFRAAYFVQSLASNRAAFALGALQYALFAFLAAALLGEDTATDLAFRFGVFIPSLLILLALTHAPGYDRWWQRATIGILLFHGLVWAWERSLVNDVGPEWAYGGTMIILSFAFTLTRLRFVAASATGFAIIAGSLGIWVAIAQDRAVQLAMAAFFMLGIQITGMVGAYLLETSRRKLFVTELRAAREHDRAERLLRNVLPEPIAQRLEEMPADGSAYIADGFDEVAVLFADLVGFTEEASRIAPSQLVATLDELFGKFDAVALEKGLEKIKTVGDEYMAVAGVPEPTDDPAAAAAEMALALHRALDGLRWPTGDPITVRIGIAIGPAVAGVIGRHKFAYDLWGDTVNLASRLERNGEPGRVLVSEALYERLVGRFEFTEPRIVDLKGKGPTTARFLLGRLDHERSLERVV